MHLQTENISVLMRREPIPNWYGAQSQKTDALPLSQDTHFLMYRGIDLHLFSYFCYSVDYAWELLRTASANMYPQLYVLSQMKKNFKFSCCSYKKNNVAVPFLLYFACMYVFVC